MVVQPYWINQQLAIVPRPRGGDWLEDEMKAMRKCGIDVLVSMLEDDEARELGLEDEGIAASKVGMQFVHFAITDRSVPSHVERFNTFVFELSQQIENGKRVGIHCRACIGRSTVAAASVLIRLGVPAQKAWLQVEEARGCRVPDTLEQRQWVDRNMKAPA